MPRTLDRTRVIKVGGSEDSIRRTMNLGGIHICCDLWRKLLLCGPRNYAAFSVGVGYSIEVHKTARMSSRVAEIEPIEVVDWRFSRSVGPATDMARWLPGTGVSPSGPVNQMEGRTMEQGRSNLPDGASSKSQCSRSKASRAERTNTSPIQQRSGSARPIMT